MTASISSLTDLLVQAHRLLFRSVSVHDDFVVDSVFPYGIFGWFLHRASGRRS